MIREEFFTLITAFNNLKNGFVILSDLSIENTGFYILEEDRDGYPEILYGLSDEDEISSWLEDFIEENNLEKEITSNKDGDYRNKLSLFLILFKEFKKNYKDAK